MWVLSFSDAQAQHSLQQSLTVDAVFTLAAEHVAARVCG